MTHSSVQGLLKNTDLLLDAAVIRSVVASARNRNRTLELHVGSVGEVYHAFLTEICPGDCMTLTLLDAETGNRGLPVGIPMAIHFYMGGYSLETRLECLEQLGNQGIRVGYPAMFRVHSKRQVSRFSVPMDMTCLVEMTLDQTVVHGELQDINLEGLSFLGRGPATPLAVDSAVRLRLTPVADEDPALELHGVLRFSGQDPAPDGAEAYYRYSVQLTDAQDPEAFRNYFNKISTCSHGWFRASVISAESYRLTTTI
ncbi:MAG: hypothetical protein HQL91_07880 [Magnetococcales bacterium]|nr:hypothetical protein [Magnetococcales bacterium]